MGKFKTYLTAKEQKAVELLAIGKNYNEVSKELKIDRTTLWQWKQKPTFEAYYNSLIKEVKEHTKEKILSLYDEALKTVESCLKSDNDNIRLKTALYLIDKVENIDFGLTDAKQIIKNQCTETKEMFDNWGVSNNFNKNKYNELCKLHGIETE
ncbi:MAG: hypothetical protein L3J35_09390 [Bacteroidales bacterium]|nr:hypothetical protein [Bacteroidales bacterium]